MAGNYSFLYRRSVPPPESQVVQIGKGRLLGLNVLNGSSGSVLGAGLEGSSEVSAAWAATNVDVAALLIGVYAAVSTYNIIPGTRSAFERRVFIFLLMRHECATIGV